MIELTGPDGRRSWVRAEEVVKVIEPRTSSAWHGVGAIVTTTDGERIETTQAASEIARRIEEELK